nr:unnamed protein product [Spodoptera littoralis]
MSLQEQFDKAAGDVKKLKSLPSDADLLELYALFKQATWRLRPLKGPWFLGPEGQGQVRGVVQEEGSVQGWTHRRRTSPRSSN